MSDAGRLDLTWQNALWIPAIAIAVWTAGGLVQVVAAFVPGTMGHVLLAASMAVMALVPVGYSSAPFRKLSSSGSA